MTSHVKLAFPFRVSFAFSLIVVENPFIELCHWKEIVQNYSRYSSLSHMKKFSANSKSSENKRYQEIEYLPSNEH